ncbi:MAG TPA: hypothetical protein VKA85_07795 [Candidatus Limnocylindrales bacterium]|nr:hypothetical protein [Candidatus Limnocylindrales bacterium]
MADAGHATRKLTLELDVDSDADVDALEGALLAAKATELAEVHRRSARHTFGYGSDSARETMSDEVAQRRRRVDMLQKLISALQSAARTR